MQTELAHISPLFKKKCKEAEANIEKLSEKISELESEIKEFGLLNRILIRPLNDDDGKYEIIAGHRRVHASASRLNNYLISNI